jgi:hypothetical protein
MNGPHIGTEGPADGLPVIQVKYHREIRPAGFGAQAGYVGNPFFSAPFGMKPTVRQIFANREPLVRVGGGDEFPPLLGV